MFFPPSSSSLSLLFILEKTGWAFMRILKQVCGEVNMRESSGTKALCPKPPELLDYSLGRNSEITCEFLTHRNYERRVYQFYVWLKVSYHTDKWNRCKWPLSGKTPAQDRQTSEDPSKDHGIFLSFIAYFQSLFHCINYLHICLFHWTMKCLYSKMPRQVLAILRIG